MESEQKLYFGIEIIVCFICLFIIVGFFLARENNNIETTVSAIGFATLYLLGFLFVLNDTVLEYCDVAKKVLVILYLVICLSITLLLPVFAKVPYKELFKTDGDNLIHPVGLMVIICGSYTLCYPVMHFFTKERNCLLQLLIKPAAPLVIPAFPILVIIVLVKAGRDFFSPSYSHYSGGGGGYESSYSSSSDDDSEYDSYPDPEPEVEETKILRFSDGHEEEVDYESTDAYHTSTGWHSKDEVE